MLALSDEELVASCKKELPGNTRSYEELVRRHMHRVYSIAYRVVSHKEEAEDIAQEVFVKVYHGLKKFEQQSSFSSWLYRIATNSALDALDKTKRHSKNVAPLTSRNNMKSEKETDVLNLPASSVEGPEEKVIQSVLHFIPRAISAALLVIFGSMLAGFLGNAIITVSNNVNITYGKALGKIIEYAIYVKRK